MVSGQIEGQSYVVNGRVADVSDFTPNMSGDIYYEVIRMIDRKFLFLQDHLDRLKHSMADSGLAYPGNGRIRESLCLLVVHNNLTLGNVRICAQRRNGDHPPKFAQIINTDPPPESAQINNAEPSPESTQATDTAPPHKNAQPNLYCYFIPYIYPEEDMYKSGVHLMTYPHERPAPGIKKWDDDFRRSVRQFIRAHGIYEAVLMNPRRQITEGSRSNIFFIDQEQKLITPARKNVLPGITRKYVLQICEDEGIRVIERSVPISDLELMEGCFISGTSPKILPVRQLDAFTFTVPHPLLNLLMERYDVLIKEHLTDLRSTCCK